MPWPTATIKTSHGPRQALAPSVISASRRTDIPACYPEWFIQRVLAGWLAWRNPYSRTSQYISLQNLRAAVFWSKNPQPMLPMLRELHQAPFGFYVQFTLNDYQAEGLEPGLPSLEKRVETFKALSRAIGAERVIWRFDPLLLVRGIEPGDLLGRIEWLARTLSGYTTKLVFSFAEIDGYARVRRNMNAAGCSWRNFSRQEMVQTAAALRALADRHGLDLAACAQSVDLSLLRVPRNACIDPDLLRMVAGPERGNPSTGSWHTLPGLYPEQQLPRGKDPGQRKHCGCAPSKDIGQYDTCPHGCLYCYANVSPSSAQARAAQVRADDDCLLPGDVTSRTADDQA